MAGDQNRLLFAPGDRVGRYEIVAEVAQGGMATVYVARLRSIGGFDKLYALKVLLPHLRANTEFVHMLLDEARIAASIQHPNVVQVVDVEDADGTPYIAMELLRGHSLRHLDRAAKAMDAKLPAGLVLGVLGRAARGLHAAHEAKDRDGTLLGVVHRDVSPENVHVGYDGHVKVLDFGIAAAAGRLTETAHGVVKGKARYLAPEQLTRTHTADRRVDVWAIGVMAHELLTGTKLFVGEDMGETMWNVLHREVPDLREVAPDVPEEVADVVNRSLTREVSGRPATCEEIALALERGARVVGGGTTEEVRDYILRALGKERVEEDARMAVALQTFIRSVSESDAAMSMDDIGAPRAKSTGRVVAALALVAAAFAALALTRPWAADSERPAQVSPALAAASSRPSTDEVSATAAPPAEVVAAETEMRAEPPAAPEAEGSTTITVDVDRRARLVLVDGERVDARPLVIELGASASSVVELYGPRGEVARHEVGADANGALLELGPSRGGRRVSRATMVEGEPSREILRDVF